MSTTPTMVPAASPAPIPSTPVAPATRSSRYSAYLALLPIIGQERVSVVLNAHEDEYAVGGFNEVNLLYRKILKFHLFLAALIYLKACCIQRDNCRFRLSTSFPLDV